MASNDAALAQLQKQAVARNGSAQQRPKLVLSVGHLTANRTLQLAQTERN